MPNQPALDHEKLDVYQASLRFVAVAEGVAEGLPRGRAYVADQLRRAALSILLNIAEGAGEFSRKDKARMYRMARRSGAECGAMLDMALDAGMGDRETLMRAKELLVRIVAMLVRLIQSVGGGSRGTGTIERA